MSSDNLVHDHAHEQGTKEIVHRCECMSGLSNHTVDLVARVGDG